jgi:DNA-binding HxlR family transcriptional regulator
MQCPVARTLERVGDWWSLLIVRDAMFGLSRFDEFRESLGISPNILSRRLKQLVESGILERRVRTKSPPVRVDYVLTSLGRAFEPLLLYLHNFGNTHFAKEGPSAVVVNRKSDRASDIQIVDSNSGLPATWPEFNIVPGPAAKQAMLDKLAKAQALVEENGNAASKVRKTARAGRRRTSIAR